MQRVRRSCCAMTWQTGLLTVTISWFLMKLSFCFHKLTGELLLLLLLALFSVRLRVRIWGWHWVIEPGSSSSLIAHLKRLLLLFVRLFYRGYMHSNS